MSITSEHRYRITESILTRQHAMLERQDSKAARLLTIFAINSAIVSFVGSLAKDGLAKAPVELSFGYSIIAVVYFIVAFGILLCALQASVEPHTKPLRQDFPESAPSFSFFGDIIRRKPEQYIESLSKIEYEEMVLDNSTQIYILARILKHKSSKMKLASKLTPALFFLFVVSVMLGILIFWLF